jgi:uncharacterized protein (TIGR00159 family)
MNPTGWFDNISVSSVIDITIVTVVVYGILLWLRRTRRAALILTGILIVAVSYLLAVWFDLVLTTAVLRGFFAVFLLALVIIFQEELRYFFERIAQWGLRPRLPGFRAGDRRLADPDVEILTRTVGDLSAERVGALIVVRGRDLIARHLRGGERLNGALSEAILKSIFDSHSLGHDGAVVIDRDRIESFGCHLPLSSNFEQLRGVGTRHAAALGLSELTDALCLVVSEERGTISVARHGRLRHVDGPRRVRDIVQHLYHEIAPVSWSSRWHNTLTRNWREKIIALGIAAGLWFVLVHGSVTVYRSFRVAVDFSGLPQDLLVTAVEPESAQVTLSGARRGFLLFKPEHLSIAARAWNLSAGVNVLTISSADLSLPDNLIVERIEPRQITVRVTARPNQDAGGPQRTEE